MNRRIGPVIFLIAYLALLFKVMVLKDVPLIRIGHLMFNFGGTQEGPSNIVPFSTIWSYLNGKKGLLIAGVNLAGNVLLLMPVGFLISFIYREPAWKKIFILSVCTGGIMEGMQVILRVGIFDIDDVILNGLGVMAGYWTYGLWKAFFDSLTNQWKRIAVIVLLSVAVVLAGLMVYPGSPVCVRFGQREVHGHPDHLLNGVDKAKPN